MAARRIAFLMTCFGLVASSTMAGYGALRRSGQELEIVEAGAVYRSGPVDRTVLEQAVLDGSVRTVINVGKAHAGGAEMSVVNGYGLRYVGFHVPGDGNVSAERLESFAEMAAEVPRPLLIRCSNGKSEARFASAVFEISAMGRTPDEAWRSSKRTFEGLALLDDGSAVGRTRLDEFALRRVASGNSDAAR